MATFSLNGKQVDAPDGMNLIEAAKLHGVEIPHYCYHPGLSVAGNCRMCLCEVEGARGPQIACAQQVKDGLVVRTDTPAVEKMRKGVQEFLLLNHPIDCPICDQAGECRLQDYYMEYGKYDNRSDVNKVQKEKALDIGPMVVLDQERCILCTRCVRFCEEISDSHELIVSGRGDTSVIETFPGKQLDNPYSGNVVDVCPVGALTSKDFRFKMRVWFMKTVKSVCTGCSRGCNVLLDYKDEVAYRYRPRANAHVNGHWMCDAGRLSYKAIHENRLSHVSIRGQQAPFMDALREVSGLMLGDRPADAYAVVGSPFSSLEANQALLALAARFMPGVTRLAWDSTAAGPQDDFLREADQSPNRAGVRYLGFDGSRQALLQALQGGRLQVLFILNNDLAQDAEVAEALRKVPVRIYLGAHTNATSALATHVLPVATHAEQYGSFINFQGRLQRFFQAFEAPGDAVPEWELLSRIGRELDRTFGWADVEEVWADLRAAHAELASLSWYGIPDEGFQIPSLGDVQAAPLGVGRGRALATSSSH
ncbi:MAG: 2Fe-2S iron-sulfur cluster-binding protein [Candidatus Sericytochromatia bacterium]|nr:2Fe-2S iron-sulfur cluster-binding protein [Candidatus Sericytochromatia bacterium]